MVSSDLQDTRLLLYIYHMLNYRPQHW